MFGIIEYAFAFNADSQVQQAARSAGRTASTQPTDTPPPGRSVGPPWGTFQSRSSGCGITNVTQARYNGQWIQVRIPIPSTYTCAYNNPDGTPNPLGCWIKIDYQFNGPILDTTSWGAFVEGDLVRIVP